MPRKEIGGPQPIGDELSDQEPMAGDRLISKKTGENEILAYQLFIERMRTSAGSVVADMTPIATEPFHCEPKPSNTAGRYIDAVISVRPTIDLSEKSKSQGWSSTQEDWYEPIYVHTYAVAQEIDYRGRIPLHSSDDVAGYVIQIGNSQDPVGIFIQTSDSAAAKKFHGDIVRAIEQTTDPRVASISFNQGIAAAFIKSNKKSGIHMNVYGAFVSPDYPSAITTATRQSSMLDVPVEKRKEIILGMSGQKERKKNIFSTRAYDNRLKRLEEEASERWTESTKPTIIDIIGDMKKGGRLLEYKDERVFACGGGAFVHLHAAPEKGVPILDSDAAIRSYIILVGLPGNRIGIRINTQARTLAESMAGRMFAAIRRADDGGPAMRTPAEARQLEFEKYQAQPSLLDPSKMLVELV
ncbi:hypothetical protein HY732_00440 [Candidatus Uhrbacteria bacterium]|nr:hypothetical protein [Candidatus Uhrbacteria bacterium]